MKKLLLIGKLNKSLQATNAALVTKFTVQISMDSRDMIRGMMKIHNPDIVVAMLSGVAPEHDDIFEEILSRQFKCPVIAVGTDAEYEEHAIALNDERVQYVEAPIENEELAQICLNTVGDDSDEEDISEEAIPNDGRKIILLVDDSAMMLRTVKRLLEPKYKTMLATSGTQAIATIGKIRPDLILLDYDMPVCDGKMTLEMIRSDNSMKDIPVVFLTGKQSRDNIMSVVNLHPAGYLIKPPNRELLLSTVEKIVG